MKNKGQIVFATGNPHKIEEVSRINSTVTFLSLIDVDITEDIPETGNTFSVNAYQKAQYVFERTGIAALAEDSGLVIDALDGQPGVLSARYAGDKKNHDANIDKVLQKLQSIEDRKAYFISMLCYIDSAGEKHFFEGKCHGEIATQRSGHGGFGYDPVFIPQGHNQSFASLSHEIKDAISHRKQSFAKFSAFIKSRV